MKKSFETYLAFIEHELGCKLLHWQKKALEVIYKGSCPYISSVRGGQSGYGTSGTNAQRRDGPRHRKSPASPARARWLRSQYCDVRRELGRKYYMGKGE